MLRRPQLVGGGEVIIPGLARARDFLLANALIVMAILLALLAVQTIRIDGLRVDLPLLPPIGPKGLKAENAQLVADNAALLKQRDAARAESLRIAALNVQATRKAEEHETADREIELPASERFIAAGGVRRCPAARTDTPTSSDSALIDERGSALPIVDDVPVVTVLPEDIRICTENTVKARAWREWGLAIKANHSPAD